VTSRTTTRPFAFGGILVEQRYIIMFALGRLPGVMLPGFYRQQWKYTDLPLNAGFPAVNGENAKNIKNAFW